MAGEIGEILTRWTIRIALGCYFARFAVNSDNSRSKKIARWCWTAGLVFYLVHVACAFQFFHHWSHSAAYEHTARQTRDVVGLDWGGGIYINYLFTLVWIIDAVGWWIRGEKYQQSSKKLFWALQIFFGFIVFNATVVFGPPFWKWLFLIAGVSYGLCRRANRKIPTESPE